MIQKHLASYKVFYILQVLLKKKLNLQELKIYLKNNFNEFPSNDMVYQYFNTLKNIGVEFKTLSKKEQKRYVIVKHPFELNLQRKEIKFLFELREQLIDTNNILTVYLYDRLLDKIYTELKQDGKDFFTTCKQQFQRKLNNKYYLNLEFLISSCQKHSFLTIEYQSPKNDNIVFDVIAEKLEFKDNAIMFYGYSQTQKETYCLRLDRINSVKFSDNIINDKYKIKYAIIDVFDSNYLPTKNQKIIKRSKNKVRIKEEYHTDFFLIQTLLKFKNKAKLIQPEELKSKLVDNLINIKRDCEAKCEL